MSKTQAAKWRPLQEQHPKRTRHPPSYYKALRSHLESQGRTPAYSAPNTQKCERSLLRKVDQ